MYNLKLYSRLKKVTILLTNIYKCERRYAFALRDGGTDQGAESPSNRISTYDKIYISAGEMKAFIHESLSECF